MKISKSVLVLIFFFLSAATLAQNNKRFRHLNINNGLAHTDALCFEQDKKGFIWIGTNSGLQRFDGRQLKTFLNETSVLRTVFYNRITALKIQDDLLWIGSEGDLNCFNLRSEKFIRVRISGKNFGSEEGVVSIIEISGKDVWGNASNKLYRCVYDSSSSVIQFYNPEEFIEKLPKRLLEANYFSLESNNRDIILTGSDAGLAVISRNNNSYVFKELLERDNGDIHLALNTVANILLDENTVWLRFGSMEQIFSLDKGNISIRNLLKTIDIETLSNDQNPGVTSYSKILTDRDDNLWIASSKGK
jgi:ligand-binding sensor domain-containing protein